MGRGTGQRAPGLAQKGFGMAVGTGGSAAAGRRGGADQDPGPLAPVCTRRLFGFDFISDSDPAATIDRILARQPDDGRLPLVITPNVDDIVRLHRSDAADLLRAVRRARYVLPDGQPIVWTSRLAGRPLRARLPGSELFGPLWRGIIDGDRRVLLVTSSEAVADGLRAELPDAVTYTPPFFDVGDAAAIDDVVAHCVELIQRRRPEFVVTGIGYPKQQRVVLGIMARLEDQGIPPPTFLLLGGSFNFHLGLTRPAPAWIKRIGAEWFHRFLSEPRRLFRRYFVTDVHFLPMMYREVRTARAARSRR